MRNGDYIHYFGIYESENDLSGGLKIKLWSSDTNEEWVILISIDDIKQSLSD